MGIIIILTAIITTSVIGLICATLIAVATKLMFVKVDVRVDKIREHLPGANCGACSFSGCDGYAEALVKGEVAANLCPPGGEATLERINEILELSGGEGLVKKLAIVHCLGDNETMRDKMDYIGIKTCVAAKQLYGGQGSCTFGCIGFGDCVSGCPDNAICVEKDLARIDPRKCSGCGVCVNACPMDVISIQLEPVHVAVLCKNTEKGAILKDKCTKGCIGCTKCVKECHTEAIKVNDSLATIDHTKCNGCSTQEPHKCANVCIKGCIATYK